jgi:hypothetical protein
MNNYHPADSDIQQYALDKNSCAKELVSHIETCSFCQEALTQYRLLFSGIREQEKPVFEFDVQALILNHLVTENSVTRADRIVGAFLVLFAFSIVGIPLYLFRTNILNVFAGISPFFIYSILICASLFVSYKSLELYFNYKKQMRFLNINQGF